MSENEQQSGGGAVLNKTQAKCSVNGPRPELRYAGRIQPPHVCPTFKGTGSVICRTASEPLLLRLNWMSCVDSTFLDLTKELFTVMIPNAMGIKGERQQFFCRLHLPLHV
jgi:hypothetical protein